MSDMRLDPIKRRSKAGRVGTIFLCPNMLEKKGIFRAWQILTKLEFQIAAKTRPKKLKSSWVRKVGLKKLKFLESGSKW